MSKLLDDQQEIASRFPRTLYMNPLPSRVVINHLSLVETLEKLEQRILELEKMEKVIVLREITRKEAKEEIKQLFKSGRTLHYSDIVRELGIDLEMVVDICNELMESGAVAIDA